MREGAEARGRSSGSALEGHGSAGGRREAAALPGWGAGAPRGVFSYKDDFHAIYCHTGRFSPYILSYNLLRVIFTLCIVI